MHPVFPRDLLSAQNHLLVMDKSRLLETFIASGCFSLVFSSYETVTQV